MPEQDFTRLLTVSGGSVASDTNLSMAPGHVITPILQAEDGSYFGTEVWTLFNSTYSSMDAFDLSGNVKWSVPNFTPVMATADGGVIAKSSAGQYETLDQNGVANGQVQNFPQIQSWLANGYQYGSIDQVAFSSIDLAASFLPQLGGNASGTGTATRPVASQIRVQIAAIASGYVGSQNWLDDTNPNDPAPNHCNIFVHDVIKQAGTNPPESATTSEKHRIAYYLGLVDSQNYPAQAGDWANPGTILKGWKTVSVPVGAPAGSFPPDYSLPGDVIAEAIQYSDATGHVGIIVNNLQHQTASAEMMTQLPLEV